MEDMASHSEEEIDNAIRKLTQVKFGMPQHKQLMHLMEIPEVLKRIESDELMVRSDQNRGLLQEVQADLFFAMDEKQHEADLTEKGRNIISGDDPLAFVLPDMLNTLQDIDANTELDIQEKLKQKQEFQESYAQKSERLQNISQLLRAYCLFENECHLLIKAKDLSLFMKSLQIRD